MEDTKTSTYANASKIEETSSGAVAKDAVEILHHRRWFLIAATVVSLVAVVVHHLSRPSYSTSAYIFSDSDQESSGFQELLTTLGNRQMNSYNEAEAEKNILLLKSSDFFQSVAAELRKSPEFARFFSELQDRVRRGWNPLTMGRRSEKAKLLETSNVVLGDLVSDMVRASIRSRGIVSVQVETGNPDLAVFLMNTYLDCAVTSLSNREGKRLKAASSFIQDKIQETLKKMEATDHDVVGMSRKSAATSLLAPQSVVAEKLLQLKVDIEKNRYVYEQNLKTIESLKAKSEAGSAGGDILGIGGPSLFGLKKTLSNLEVENELLVNRIEVMKRGLDELLKSNMSLPRQEMVLADLKRQKDLAYYVFDTLFKTHLQLEVRGVSLQSRVYPLQHVTREQVVLTNRLPPKLLVAGLLALLFSSAAAYCWQLISPLLRNKKDFEDLDVSYLGSVPSIAAEHLIDRGSRRQLCNFDIESRETIAFKHIRSRIVHLATYSGTNPRKVISLLSYGNGEGKTFLTSNLAACFAFMGKRTLVLDFDLRRASLSQVFSLNGQPGLCDYLARGVDLDTLVRREVAPGLDMIPAGDFVPSIAEKLSNARFNQILDHFRAKYDFILIDTAPILVAHESIVIARESDFAVLIATSWKTRREYIQDAIEEIRNVRRASIHFVLNQVKETNVSLVSNYYYVGSLGRRRAEEVRERTKPLDN